MQLPEIDFSSLELREIGAWPLILRVGVITGAVIAAVVVMYLLVFTKELSDLDAAESRLADKMKQFKDQYTQAVNLDAYKEQMDSMQKEYQEYVNELPSSSNIPELIDSITKIGERNGLKINSIKIGDAKLLADFYMTLPLTLDLTGSYHSMGLFVSDVAKLARIVTLSDFTIKPSAATKQGAPSGQLEININAQTYWLASLSEMEQQKASEAKTAPKGPKKTTAEPAGTTPPRVTGAPAAPGKEAPGAGIPTPPGVAPAGAPPAIQGIPGRNPAGKRGNRIPAPVSPASETGD